MSAPASLLLKSSVEQNRQACARISGMSPKQRSTGSCSMSNSPCQSSVHMLVLSKAVEVLLSRRITFQQAVLLYCEAVRTRAPLPILPNAETSRITLFASFNLITKICLLPAVTMERQQVQPSQLRGSCILKTKFTVSRILFIKGAFF